MWLDWYVQLSDRCSEWYRLQCKSGLFERPIKFQEKDLVNGEVIPFSNIYDKGYWEKMIALRNGRELVLQPAYACSDRQFQRQETIISACVATDHNGNKRAVNVCKRSDYVRCNFMENMCPKRFNTVWTPWSFQATLMFKPVL